MSRSLLVVSTLAACSSSPDLTGVDPWLDAWSKVRRCLVDPGEDVATGIAIEWLTSHRTCSFTPMLAAEPTEQSPLHDLWRAANHELGTLDREARPSVQAAKVEQIDRASLILALARGRAPHAVATEPRIPMIAEVPPKGVFHSVEGPSWSYPHKAEWLGRGKFAERGRDRIVLDHYGHRSLEGLIVHRSHDRGVTWDSEKIPWGVLRGGMTDPKGGQFWRYFQRNGFTTVERFDADGTLNVYPARLSWRPAQRCRSSVSWILLGGYLSVEGDDSDGIKVDREDDLVACDRAGALVLARDKVLRCQESCKPVFTRPVGGSGSATLLPDGRWIYVASLEGVVASWVEGLDGPKFHRLPDPTDEVVALGIADGAPMLLLGWQRNEIIAFPSPPPPRAITSTQP